MGITWSPPLEDLAKYWASLPESFTVEADHRAEEAVQGAAVAIKQVYSQHWVTGNLTTRVYASRRLRGKLATIWKVTAGAPHTWLFENGTKQRFYITKPGKTPGSGGKVHKTGAMWKGQPPPKTFFPTVNRFRRQFETQLVQMLERAGLLVRVSE